MKANLLSDRSLILRIRGATRIIRPHHDGYGKLLALYHKQRTMESVRLSAAVAESNDCAELAAGIAAGWNRQQEEGQPVELAQMEHAAAVLARGSYRVERAVESGEWHAWPVSEINEDGTPMQGGVVLDGERVMPRVSLSAAAVEQAAGDMVPPSLAQQRTGNYRKGRFELHGLPIAIEIPKGSIRFGRSREGVSWSAVVPFHCGVIAPDARSERRLDCVIGPTPDTDVVYVIDPAPRNGGDHPKVMLGFDTEAQARQAFFGCFPPGWRVGSIRAVPVAAVRRWLALGSDRWPISAETIRLSAASMVAMAGGMEVSADVRAEAERAVRLRIGDVLERTCGCGSAPCCNCPSNQTPT